MKTKLFVFEQSEQPNVVRLQIAEGKGTDHTPYIIENGKLKYFCIGVDGWKFYEVDENDFEIINN